MRKLKYVAIPVVIALAILLTMTMWPRNRRLVCGFPEDRMIISSVHYGAFMEWIPMTGELQQDTISNPYHVEVHFDEMYAAPLTTGLKGTTYRNDSTYVLELMRIHPDVVDGRITADMNFVNGIPRNEGGDRVFRIRMALGDSTEATLLPIGGFFRDTGGKWVYVVENDLAVRREVRLGRKNFDNFEVIEGLKPGERVITSSYESFKEKESFALD